MLYIIILPLRTLNQFCLQYEGGRATANFVNFLNEKEGMQQRLPSEKLSDQKNERENIQQWFTEKIISEA